MQKGRRLTLRSIQDQKGSTNNTLKKNNNICTLLLLTFATREDKSLAIKAIVGEGKHKQFKQPNQTISKWTSRYETSERRCGLSTTTESKRWR